MKAQVLVVEGNAEATSAQMIALGARPYGESYAQLLESLSPEVACTVVYPAEDGVDCLPPGKKLSDYDGIAWTGSALSAYMDRPEVHHQIELAKLAYDSGTPVFGSCWGLQIMAIALGGSVRANPKGREIGIGHDIELTQAGLGHPLYAGKDPAFDVLSVHLDEVETLPDGAVLLAGNAVSEVQAFFIEENGNSFWGVQYHPEFDFEVMALVLRRLRTLLIKEGVFENEESVDERIEHYMALHRRTTSSDDRTENDADETTQGADRSAPHEFVFDPDLRRVELFNWLRTKVIGGE
ncbi:MAG: type 1 glutamine amidotransferase [Candidatus Hydrogenedentes bacterium]|nr:type 1 glutamine amidotransferase [Candidatus Hydrogenedentota bacterium]